MSTEAQLHANRANAQKSTGPKTAAGKSKSAANASRHGLQANPTTIFETHPHERSQYDALKAKLFEQILPDGELELQTFERYVFATFQAQRARQMEIDTQDRWLNEPNQNSWFLQMERFIKLAALQERRADRALAELRKLQRDRLAALDVQNELFLLDQNIPIPATLPIAEMRKTDQSKTSPALIAMSLLSTAPEVQAILNGQTKPNPVEPVTVSTEDLLRLQQLHEKR